MLTLSKSNRDVLIRCFLLSRHLLTGKNDLHTEARSGFLLLGSERSSLTSKAVLARTAI